MARSDLMFVVFVLMAAAVLFAVVVIALGRGDLLDVDLPPAAEPLLPDGDVSTADIEGLRFAIVQRGYRMDQVDAVLDRLESELAERDRRIGDLEARVSGPASPGKKGAPLPRRRPGRSADTGR